MTTDSDLNEGLRVELRGAPLPWIGWFAHHYWVVVQDSQGSERWEVWQRPNCAKVCSGHLHRDLLPPTAGVGGGDSWVLAHWQGELANDLANRARESLFTYPWCQRYRYVPGPNSNTYVQWLLQDLYRLPWQAFGRHYVVSA
ncbi:MAG: DUF3750 domain-containing protein [Pseudomonadales bacterium]